jgi:hypothetical protein
MTGRAACPIKQLRHAQMLNTDRTRLVKQRPRPVQRLITTVTFVCLRLISDFWRSGKKLFQLLENARIPPRKLGGRERGTQTLSTT